MPAPSKVWFITGSSTGFGREMAELLLRRGNKLLVLKLDVTKEEEIKSTFAEGYKAFGKVDVVFNNAGIFAIGEVEGTSEATIRHLFDTSFIGA
ncbi:hypothetical protein HYDPIDRAFT_119513, partial [Hydnomerulius pinastri MD-312]